MNLCPDGSPTDARGPSHPDRSGSPAIGATNPFDIMSVLEWTSRYCLRVGASERVRLECFSLVGSVKSKGGTERDAAMAVKRLLEARYPEQITMEDV